ncbi:GGDEF domain-containing protein [Thalassomonas viridans]|uniref:diguanylate cyclase n=1 Tax=Thalassomonas viridans TaxID=137584 RepID=A0AAE9YZL7_9GAMM|nr:sensor domain-containing diguanylate cyclase [Thalassomonas viridans]WDE04106.1 GGDEF domain-containing protein [Thalassomonas viridans]
MSLVHKFDHFITALFFFIIITVAATSYFTFKEFFAIHNKRQQEAVIPLFSLITSEVISPLSISQYMAKDPFVIDYIEQEEIDTQTILTYLRAIATQYQMVSFIAIEKHNLMIDSNNKRTELSSDEAEWYHRLKEIDQEQFTDIGNADDPHLYFDVKIFNNKQEFIGFIGVAIDLNYFADRFREFQQRFGFELFFVDAGNIITLSSNSIMKTESHHRKNELVNISSFPWYQSFVDDREQGKNPPVAATDNNELIVSQMPIKELGWRLFIVAPPASKQGEYWQLFFSKLLIFVLVSGILYFAFASTIGYFKSSLVKNSQIDFLTQLPNRSYIHRQYQQLAKTHDNASIIMADVDLFKEVNDKYGHNTGDEVLKVIGQKLTSSLRKIDLSGRWGGEEFIVILPETNAGQAQKIVERIRLDIAGHQFPLSGEKSGFFTSVSFGLVHGPLTKNNLQTQIDKADKALYRAKLNGRNRVQVYAENDKV